MSTQTAENLNIINNEDQLRADMYSFLANLLRAEPSVELVNQLTKLESDESPIGKSIKTLSKLASSLDLPTIRDEYVRIFIGVGRGEILPFASYYLTGFLKDKPLAKLRNDMKEIGIELAENVKEPEDRIASLFDMMSGLILAQRMPLFCVIAMMDPKTVWLIFIWKAQISIAAGSIRRCCNPVAPAAMRPIAEY